LDCGVGGLEVEVAQVREAVGAGGAAERVLGVAVVLEARGVGFHVVVVFAADGTEGEGLCVMIRECFGVR
jgi:hypothetical protein